MVKKSACLAGDSDLIPGSGKSPGDKNGNSGHFPLFLLAKPHGQRRMAAHGVTKESDMLATKQVKFRSTALICSNVWKLLI